MTTEELKPLNPIQKVKELERVGEAGVWEDYDDQTRFLVRSNECATFLAAREAKMAEVRKKYKNRIVPDDVIEEALKEVYAAAGLIGWEGVPTSETNDEPLEFSPENAAKVINIDKRWWNFIVAVSASRRRFEVEIEEQRRKNLSTATSGSSSGVAASTNSEQLH